MWKTVLDICTDFSKRCESPPNIFLLLEVAEDKPSGCWLAVAGVILGCLVLVTMKWNTNAVIVMDELVFFEWYQNTLEILKNIINFNRSKHNCCRVLSRRKRKYQKGIFNGRGERQFKTVGFCVYSPVCVLMVIILGPWQYPLTRVSQPATVLHWRMSSRFPHPAPPWLQLSHSRSVLQGLGLPEGSSCSNKLSVSPGSSKHLHKLQWYKDRSWF